MKSWWPTDKKSDLEIGRPGRLGRTTPVGDSNSEQSHNITNKDRGQQVVIQSHVSLPLVIVLVVLGAMSAAAIGIAWNADYASRLGERNIQIARNHADDARYQLEVLRGILQSYKIPVPEPTKESDEHDRR